MDVDSTVQHPRMLGLTTLAPVRPEQEAIYPLPFRIIKGDFHRVSDARQGFPGDLEGSLEIG